MYDSHRSSISRRRYRLAQAGTVAGALAVGSLVVAFHNVWEGLPTLVTLLGWAQVLKGFVAFVLPQVALRGLARVSPERAWEFVAAGVAFLALTAVFWYIVFTR